MNLLAVAAGVLVESTGKKRDRSYAYRAYLDRLKVGTELAPPMRSLPLTPPYSHARRYPFGARPTSALKSCTKCA